MGRWRSRTLPRVVLALRADGSYDYGPEDAKQGETVHGSWRLDDGDLVLAEPTRTERAPVKLSTSRSYAKSGLDFGNMQFSPVGE